MKRIVSKTFFENKFTQRSYNSLLYVAQGLLLKGNILENLPAQITHAGDWKILEGIK